MERGRDSFYFGGSGTRRDSVIRIEPETKLRPGF
jgi:hypothetical protein